MKTSALLLALPLVVVGAGTAGAWYTGTQVEDDITLGLVEVNEQLQTLASGPRVDVSLLGVERGLFSSEVRYQVRVLDAESGETDTLVFVDHLEHGPFPPSRLARGQLMPVMTQSHFALERTPYTQPLFDAAAGQAPLSGALTLGYDGERQGELSLAALAHSKPEISLRLSPARLDFWSNADYSAVRLTGALAELELTGVAPDSGRPVRIEARGLALSSDKQNNDAGFALGPSRLSVEQLQLQAGTGAAIRLQDASVEEDLSQNGARLDQRFAYRIGSLAVREQPVGSLDLTFAARGLDQAAIRELADAYNRIVLDHQGEGDLADIDLTPAQQAQLKTEALGLLDAQPTLALDALSLKTANGQARLAFTLDLRRPDPQAASLDAAVDSAVAALDAELQVDKALIGDFATLQARLAGAPDDPAMLQQQAAAASELLSGLAVGSGWAQLDEGRLTSALHYADGRVRFNGQEMSAEEFLFFALGSAQGMGLR